MITTTPGIQYTTTPNIVYTTTPNNTSKNGVQFTLPANIRSMSSNTMNPMYVMNPVNITNTPVVTAEPKYKMSTDKIGDPGNFMDSLQHYLVNSPLLQDNNGDNDNIAQQILEINTNMNEIASTLSNNESSKILSQQHGMKTIIDKEMDRLKQKKNSIENAMTTQKRMMIMNDSFLKKQRMYSQMAIAIVIGLSIILIFRYFSIQYPELENLANVISIFIVVSVFIYCMWIYIGILRRDPIYFDQISYIPEKITQAPSIDQGAYVPPGVQSQLLSRNTSYTDSCVGPDCCSLINGTVWDSSNNICKIKESFGQRKKSKFTYEEVR